MKKFVFLLLAALACVGTVFGKDVGSLSYRVSVEEVFTGENISEAQTWFGGAAEYTLYNKNGGLNPIIVASAGIGYIDSNFKYGWANAGLGVSKTEKDTTYSIVVKSSTSDFLPQAVGYVKTPWKIGDLNATFELSGGIYLPIGDQEYSFYTKGNERYSGIFVEPTVTAKIAGINMAISVNYTETNQVVLGNTFKSWKVSLYQEWSNRVRSFVAYATDPWYPTIDGIVHVGVIISGSTSEKKPATPPATEKPAETSPAASS